MVIGTICILIVLLLFMGASFKPLRFMGGLCVKLIIGAMLLFFLNAFAGSFGIHIPINLVTAGISGILGVPGVLSLAAIQYWIL